MMNNPIWIMSSAFKKLHLTDIIKKTVEIGAQGIEICVFRRHGDRKDNVATHIDYENFSQRDAQNLIDTFNKAGLRFSIGAYENYIGGNPEERKENHNHLLQLIRVSYLLGGDENDVKVGTFVGYNHELGNEDNGFQKNLEEYVRVFTPIVKYAEDHGVKIIYENCPMEGWRPATISTTYNNLPATLAARKLMYSLIPSKAHGETYDPSHDVWQNIDPVEVINCSDISRIYRIHVKGTRILHNEARIHWGGVYPMHAVDAELAQKAGIPTCAHEWDRHHYVAMMPGFGGTDSMDWKAFVEVLMKKGFQGPFVMENEAANSSGTGNMGAIMQGFKAGLLCLAPIVWPLSAGEGYKFNRSDYHPLKNAKRKDISIVSIDELT